MEGLHLHGGGASRLFISLLSLLFLLQTIVDHFDSQKCSVSERLKLFYCSGAPTRWIVQVTTNTESTRRRLSNPLY